MLRKTIKQAKTEAKLCGCVMITLVLLSLEKLQNHKVNVERHAQQDEGHNDDVVKEKHTNR
jgi:predicted class III extradiol MEMO1 family dioxygenase